MEVTAELTRDGEGYGGLVMEKLLQLLAVEFLRHLLGGLNSRSPPGV